MFRLNRRKRTVAVAPGKPGPEDRLWLDQPNVQDEIERRSDDIGLKGHALEIVRHGATVVRGAIPADLCAAVRVDHAEFSRLGSGQSIPNQHGRHERLGNLHLVSEAALKIGTNARLMEILDFFLGYRAGIYSSLTFERSTEQDLHRDTPFFHTLPPGFFFGVWTALEDIDDDAGPLVYLDGGHRAELEPTAYAASLRVDGEDETFPSRLYDSWQAEVARRAEAAGARRVSPTLRMGDTMIWHPDLPHGGGKIANWSLTRASIVFHCTPVNVPLYGPHEFFGLVQPQPLVHIPMREYAGRMFVDHGEPQLFSDANPQQL